MQSNDGFLCFSIIELKSRGRKRLTGIHLLFIWHLRLIFFFIQFILRLLKMPVCDHFDIIYILIFISWFFLQSVVLPARFVSSGLD